MEDDDSVLRCSNVFTLPWNDSLLTLSLWCRLPESTSFFREEYSDSSPSFEPFMPFTLINDFSSTSECLLKGSSSRSDTFTSPSSLHSLFHSSSFRSENSPWELDDVFGSATLSPSWEQFNDFLTFILLVLEVLEFKVHLQIRMLKRSICINNRYNLDSLVI